jgi:manganese/zinc/iron transport system substrate-binding protein
MHRFFLLFSLAALAAVGCGPAKPAADVLCTTTTIGDAATRISGGKVRVEVLLGPGTDPHKYAPSAGDLDRLTAAKLVLFNGLHLEGKMTDVLERSPGGRAVAVTRDLPESKLLKADVDGGDHDPHVWFDVQRWKVCVGTVRDAMVAKFPEHAETFRTNSADYLKELDDLDEYVKSKTKELGPKPVLVTSHDAFNYFADAYGFTVHGLQGVSTGAESGTARVEELASVIVADRVPALFTETSVDPKGLKQLLDAVNQKGWKVKLVGEADSLYSDSLGAAGTPAATYPGTVRHNIDVIVKHLRPAK